MLQVQRRDQFDRIVVETTGLANPAPIIQTFILDQNTSDNMNLDGVVTLVDAKHVEQHLDDKKEDGSVNEALEQIAYADRIILNKTDLVSLVRRSSNLSLASCRLSRLFWVPADHASACASARLLAQVSELALDTLLGQ